MPKRTEGKSKKMDKDKIKRYEFVDALTNSLGISLFPNQREILTQAFMDNDFNFLISTPPGTGKSLLAFLAMARAYTQGLKAIYLTPLKSIISEKKCEFSKYLSILFPEAHLGVFTGEQNDGNERDFDFLLMTYEKLDSCIRRLSANFDWFSNVGCIAIDEFHQIDENIRGARLEGLLTRISRCNPFVRLVCFSATIPNLYEVSNFLNAVPFTSSWVRISVNRKIRLFENVTEKEMILIEEIRKTICEGGKVLVFVNSRRRSEELCKLIRENGLGCLHHHAGLKHKERMSVENEFRLGNTPVLVSTSTLEMGVNLPARKVINYDSSTFTYEGFVPLSVRSFVQRSGRAGRPGLDDFGESVLLLPSWSKLKDNYINIEIEDVRSSVNFKKNLSEQVILELTSGLSRNRKGLEVGFLPRTLFSLQNGREYATEQLRACIPDLLSAGLVNEKDGYLTPTNLGRVLSYLYISPESIKTIRSLLENIKPERFDFLLCISLLAECEPKIWINSEDFQIIEKTISKIESKILEMKVSDIMFYTNLSKQMVLSAVKSAVILNGIIESVPENLIADKFGIYEIDISLLRANAKRLLDNARVIFNILGKKEHADKCKLVSFMLQNGLQNGVPEERTRMFMEMCMISGLGVKRCRKLVSNGIKNVYDLSTISEYKLSKICGIGMNLSKSIIKEAKEKTKKHNEEEGKEKDEKDKYEKDKDKNGKGKNMNANCFEVISHDLDLENRENIRRIRERELPACPHRLKRSLELSVKSCGDNKWIVSGGREEHKVIRFVGLECDCKDYLSRRCDCKHILAVKREIGLVVLAKNDDQARLRDSFSMTTYSARYSANCGNNGNIYRGEEDGEVRN